MILTHKTGVLLHGTLAKDPVLKDVGQKRVLKFDVKAHSVKTDTGSWESLYVQVNVWHGLDKWDGLLLKGDAVTVFARELKSREYNGKTYYNVDADDIQPGGMVIFRWMQNLIDLCTEAPAPPEPALTQEPTPFDEPAPVQTAFPAGRCIPAKTWPTMLPAPLRRQRLPGPPQAPRKQMPSSTMMRMTCRFNHTRKEFRPWALTHPVALLPFPAV